MSRFSFHPFTGRASLRAGWSLPRAVAGRWKVSEAVICSTICPVQGNNTYKVYERAGENRYVLTIDPKDGRIDDVSDTDGICVSSCPTSRRFAKGLFIVQDGTNAVGNQNFKLYAWEDIAGTQLLIDTSWQPRGALE